MGISRQFLLQLTFEVFIHMSVFKKKFALCECSRFSPSRMLRHVHWSPFTDVSKRRGAFIGNCIPVDTAIHSLTQFTVTLGARLDNCLIFCSKIVVQYLPSGWENRWLYGVI